MKYRYIGASPKQVNGNIVKTDDIIEVKHKINNPLFELVVDEKKSKVKEKKYE